MKQSRKTRTTTESNVSGYLAKAGVGSVVLDGEGRIVTYDRQAERLWADAARLEGVPFEAIRSEFLKSDRIECAQPVWVARAMGRDKKSTLCVRVVRCRPTQRKGRLLRPLLLVPVGPNDRAGDNILVLGHFRLDRDAGTLMYRRDYVPLTSMEFRLLARLAEYGDRILEKRELLANVWGLRHQETRTLDVTISRLRRKLTRSGCPDDLVRTVHGRGYCFFGGTLVGRDRSLRH